MKMPCCVYVSSYNDTCGWLLVELAGSVCRAGWLDEPKLLKTKYVFVIPHDGTCGSLIVELAGSASRAEWLDEPKLFKLICFCELFQWHLWLADYRTGWLGEQDEVVG